jgi:hypothetical protein
MLDCLKRSIACSLVALAVWLPVTAKAFTYEGTGVASCSEWQGARNALYPGVAREEDWVLGFLSGFAAASQDVHFDPLAGVDAFGVCSWIDDYCQEHPNDGIISAAAAFLWSRPLRCQP